MPNFDLFIDPKTKKKLFFSDNELFSEDGTIRYPVINNIPRFVEENLYKDVDQSDSLEEQTGRSFGKKWRENAMKKPGVDNPHERKLLVEQFAAMLGCDTVEEIEKLLKTAEMTLNGGCGTSWSEYLFDVNPLCERHCIDLSLAVESAYENTKEMKNVTVSQASVLEIPYAENVFDIVYSDGVVHHTPDPEKATKELGRRVRSGGVFGIYIYNKKPFIRELVDKEIRKITTTMEYDTCLEFSRQMSLLGKALHEYGDKPFIIQKDMPLLGIKAGRYNLQKFIYDYLVKCWYNPDIDIQFADLVNLDWYHPAYASHHDKEEVLQWFEDVGFVNLKCKQPNGWEHSGYFISGTRK